jgi:hypothetical protein
MEKLKIYLSYSHIDKELAKQFYDYLNEQGFEVLWDNNILLPGDNFEQKLNRYLFLADIYLPIISNSFLESVYAKNEFSIAIGYNSSREKPRIYPYISNGTDIPKALNSVLCFMGTDNIKTDLVCIKDQLNTIKGQILAKDDIDDEQTKNIKDNLDTFLDNVFNKLETNEKKYQKLAYIAYLSSAFFLILIIPFTIYKTFIMSNSHQHLSLQIISTIQNISALAVLVALSRLSFVLGKSFMVESIRNGDRIHAIWFGKFYIRAYGKQASREEIREVFGEWNIDKGSSFSKQDAKEINPQIIDTLDVLKSLMKQ